MQHKKYLFAFALLISCYLGFAAKPTLQPIDLKCELFRSPLGIDVDRPGLSYTISATAGKRGVVQAAYQILVSDAESLLTTDKGNVWNSGKVNSNQMAYISYAGKPLISGKKYWWKVRVWDKNGEVSAWSSVANWTMGLLTEQDWKANWITASGAEKFSLTPFGYRAKTAASQTDAKWVQVDLGKKTEFDVVRITPVFFEDRAGYGFPSRFKIEFSDDENFASSTIIANHTGKDFYHSRWKPVSFAVKNGSGRFVRFTATKLWGGNRSFQFALRQIEVFAGKKNIASGGKIKALDANEANGWTKENLTDEPLDRAALPNYASMALRKDFSVNKNLVRATVFISGMSEFELTVNGQKVGNDLLTPGWTEYTKTVLYSAYDVTAKLKAGLNAVGIILGNGMYNIQPDSIRYVKVLNSYGPLKAIAQLRLTYADGSVKTIGTDKTWQVAPGPITYSNMFGGEDYNANLEIKGWNTASFKTSENWKPVVVCEGPGGKLKGLSCSAPPVQVIETKAAVKITKIKENIWIYDFGQNASMMPKLAVTGAKGSYVRMIPSELLGENGLVDRKSATQDGVRPAWWQYTLAGKDVENWKPKFFYQGARYLQVELFPAMPNGSLPKVLTIEDLIVHSSAEPVGKFETSNPLFNKIYNLVRWAQRSNMQSLMTDCPHREKMGWLEENHLNGPSLRYNFDMSQLFRKTMSDMADAQLSNGLIPSIAPEYFIAGSPALDNPMRNSTEWGGSFIILPWQQYLFSGDISLLQRYYDRMKKYVSFLASTAKDHIIVVGLGDWYDIGPKPAWGSQLTPESFTGTAVYYYDNEIMYNVAKLLGKTADADAYKKAMTEIRAAFNAKFFNASSVSYATGSNTTYAMPLFFNLAEPQHRQQLIKGLVDSIRKNNNSFNSGEVGFRFLLRSLADGGYSNVVYDMNNQSEKPGYGYQIKKGATSLTEKWDAGVGDFGSQNHFMSGQINEWFFNDLIGISPDENGAGFRKFAIKPAFVPDLKWVNGSYKSMSGTITCNWKRTANGIELDILVPANTAATLYLPLVPREDVVEGNTPIDKAEGLSFVSNTSNQLVYQVQSGSYHLTIK